MDMKIEMKRGGTPVPGHLSEFGRGPARRVLRGELS